MAGEYLHRGQIAPLTSPLRPRRMERRAQYGVNSMAFLVDRRPHLSVRTGRDDPQDLALRSASVRADTELLWEPVNCPVRPAQATS